MHCVEINLGYASILIDAKPPERKYVDETSKGDILFNQQCMECIMITVYTLLTYIFNIFFLKDDTTHSWKPCRI